MSTWLFNVFIGGVLRESDSIGKKFESCKEEVMEVVWLMYAENAVLIAKMSAFVKCGGRKMGVNTTKSNDC